MSKKRKIEFIVIIILMVLIIAFLLYSIGKSIYDYVNATKNSHEIVEKFNEIYEKEDTNIILFASKTCKWCKQFVPVLDEVTKENNLEYAYLEVGLLTEDDLKEIYGKLEIKYEGIPHLVIIKNKKVIGEQIGAQDKETTIELFKEIELIEGEDNDGESISTNS